MSHLFSCLLCTAENSALGYIPCCTSLCTSNSVKCCSGTRAQLPVRGVLTKAACPFPQIKPTHCPAAFPQFLHQLRNYIGLSMAVLQRRQQYNKSVYNSDLPWLLYLKCMCEWKRWGKISSAVGIGIHRAGNIFHISTCFPFYSVVILKHWVAFLLLCWRSNTPFKMVVIHLSSPDLSFGLAALLQLDYRTISL